uniref:C-X-C motif chemokine 13-like n=1 Tax=Gasterosteus aculeatus aculeatus TaxID=481459 RepID=UPI001A988B9F|nr:C-X-C motif chemokine 13-like [Gasterosteus aculeatus aculeatus]
MKTPQLLLLLAVTLCCCVARLHAFPTRGCRCIRTTSDPVPTRVIRRIEVVPVSGLCRRTEIIVTRRNGSKLCVNPDEAWLHVLLSKPQHNSLIST